MTERMCFDPFLLICALRYALPRHTYVTGAIADEVKKWWPHLHQSPRSVIRRDVVEHLADTPPTGNRMQDLDRDVWVELLQWIDAQAEREVNRV